MRLWWRWGRVLAGVVGVWALQQDVSRTGGSGGSGDGPRVHTGIVTPHHSYLPHTITDNKFRRHHRSLVTTPLHLHHCISPLSPRRKLISSLCTRLPIHTYTYACVCVNVCVCVYVCVCGGFCDRTTYPAQPWRPFTHPFSIYIYTYIWVYVCVRIYIVYVLYSRCCWVPYSQRTPLHAALSVIPNTNTFTLTPSVRQCRQSSTGSGSTTASAGWW